MARKTSDPFVKTNQEYTKARTATGHDGGPYREQPQRQAPGGAGYEKPDFARWTDEEILTHARGLNLLADDQTPPRAELIRLLDEAQPPGR